MRYGRTTVGVFAWLYDYPLVDSSIINDGDIYRAGLLSLSLGIEVLFRLFHSLLKLIMCLSYSLSTVGNNGIVRGAALQYGEHVYINTVLSLGEISASVKIGDETLPIQPSI